MKRVLMASVLASSAAYGLSAAAQAPVHAQNQPPYPAPYQAPYQAPYPAPTPAPAPEVSQPFYEKAVPAPNHAFEIGGAVGYNA